MTVTELHRDNAFAGSYATGWVASVLLHGSLVVGAVFFAQQVQLAPQLDPFKWDVTLVSSASSPMPSSPSASPPEDLSPAQATAPAAMHQTQPAPPVTESKQSDFRPPPPQILPTSVPPIPPPQAESQPVQPVPQTVAPTPEEVVKSVEPVPTAALIEPPVPVAPIMHTPTAVESAGSPTQATYSESLSVPAPRQLDSPAAVASTVTEPPTVVSPIVAAFPELATAITPHVTASPGEPSVPTVSTTAQIAALAPTGANKPARVDYGWLSEVILRRVEELKLYPAEARADRAEGKVVVKAVINEDGSVENVEIFQSSGFATLDKAAVDLMLRAAPFSLPHSLEKPRITVKIPMNYRLVR